MENTQESTVDFSSGKPIMIRVENTSGDIVMAKIFNPKSSKDENYGNVTGVKCSGCGYGSYDDILQSLSGNIVNIGSILFELQEGEKPFIKATVQTENPLNGRFNGVRMEISRDPYQNQKDMVLGNTPFQLNNANGNYTFIETEMLPHTSFNVCLYPSFNSGNVEHSETVTGENV